jgi:hypothetical protein
MNWTFPNQDELQFGARGMVTGRAFLESDCASVERVAVTFPGNKGAVAMRLAEISRNPPVIPGGYKLGDKVFYTHPSWKAPDGYLLTFGVEGKLIGRSCIGDGRDDERVWVRFPGLGYGSIHLDRISKEMPVIPGGYQLGDEVYFAAASFAIGHSAGQQHISFGAKGKVAGGRESRSDVAVAFPGHEDAVDILLSELSPVPPVIPDGFELEETVYYNGSTFCSPEGYLATYGAKGVVTGRSCTGDGLDDKRVAVEFLGIPGSMVCHTQNVSRELPPRLEEQLTAQLRGFLDLKLLAATYRTAKDSAFTNVAEQALELAGMQVDEVFHREDVAALSQLQRAAEDARWSELQAYTTMALNELMLPRTLQAARTAKDYFAQQALEQYICRWGTPKKKSSIHTCANLFSTKRELSPKQKELHNKSLRNFEIFHGLPAGSATIDQVQDSAAGIQGWATSTPKQDFHQIVEGNNSVLIRQMQAFVDETYTAWGGHGRATRTRDRHSTLTADNIQVVAVEHLQNNESYINYCLRKEVIRAELATLDASRKVASWDVKTDRIASDFLTLDVEVNEHYLWHGTGPSEAQGIAATGFDLGQAGCRRGALYGRGAYFAESSLKADEYVKANECGWFPLILCRVTLGQVRYCDADDPSSLRDSLRAACRGNGAGTGNYYHSVLGDREKVRQTFREFVLFNSAQVYPEFIVWYVKS